MQHQAFEAIGTQWSILIDTEKDVSDVFVHLRREIDRLDSLLSRFIATSEVCRLAQQPAGEYDISQDLAHILQAGKKLEIITQGNFNLAIGTIMEAAGYDAQYQLSLAPEHIAEPLYPWSVQGNKVSVSGPTLFDVGSIGKGYIIDAVAQLLLEAGLSCFLIDAGGDMFGTQKAGGEPWQIALEWPGKPELALGTLALQQSGFAASDTHRRSWKNWHHLISAQTQKPLTHLSGCFSVAPSAFLADQTTSALSFLPQKDSYQFLTETFQAEYLVLLTSGNALASPHWQGKFF